MFGLKSVYFYLLAVQITIIKILKKIYFSSKNYNKSLESITPQQVYYSPNPFLLSIITSYKNRSFKINEVDPNVFWLEDKKKNSTQAHNFLWLNLIDRKGDQKNLKRIKLVKKYAKKRAELKKIINNKKLELSERFEAQLKLNKLPKNSAKIRIRNRCEVSGRPHGVYRKLRISRIALRDMASAGKIPSITKSSW